MACMVTSDSGDDTAFRNDYVAGMDQASDSDSNGKSSFSAVLQFKFSTLLDMEQMMYLGNLSFEQKFLPITTRIEEATETTPRNHS